MREESSLEFRSASSESGSDDLHSFRSGEEQDQAMSRDHTPLSSDVTGLDQTWIDRIDCEIHIYGPDEICRETISNRASRSYRPWNDSEDVIGVYGRTSLSVKRKGTRGGISLDLIRLPPSTLKAAVWSQCMPRILYGR